MATSKKSKTQKTVKKKRSDIRHLFSLNIGTIIFGAIFLYMVITVILYLTATHISSYQVTAGPLAKNQTYTALALRSEQVMTADTSGYLTYYGRENSKVKKNGVVYSIGETQAEDENISLTDAALAKIRSQMSKFSSSFDSTDFHDLYSFKYDLEGGILQYSNISIPVTTTNGGNTTLGSQTICTAPADGMVLYTVDGYEQFDPATLTAAAFDERSYERVSLKTKDRVTAGDKVYKLITSEDWSLYIPLSDKQIVQLNARTQIRVKFLKDNATQVADFTILTGTDGAYYGKLTFSSGLIRYANDRFLDIELVTNTKSGLKIPVSSIVNKAFYVIPEEFATQGGDSSNTGFLREFKDKSGNTTSEFLTTTIYENKDGKYYVEMSDFEKGDVILKSDSSDRYIIGETDTLEGVYSMNRGYAVFRKVAIIDKNEEYCIVEKGTSFGIAQFDHIVLDSSTVKEQEVIY
ncbi:MAG: HlyD family efflux transporter periplasmic adaptor subunit [Lachnospiraceae bacterium]|nr:HlyD family efflux transporter periplasmic adaptor subunit [Lachnospiraceae bacterium]